MWAIPVKSPSTHFPRTPKVCSNEKICWPMGLVRLVWAVPSLPVFAHLPSNPRTPLIPRIPLIPSTPLIPRTSLIPRTPLIPWTPLISRTPLIKISSFKSSWHPHLDIVHSLCKIVSSPSRESLLLESLTFQLCSNLLHVRITNSLPFNMVPTILLLECQLYGSSVWYLIEWNVDKRAFGTLT